MACGIPPRDRDRSFENFSYHVDDFAATQTVEKLFDQKAAAHLLGVSVRTLERHRVAGTGPRFARLGRLVRYRKCDLADWVEKNSVGSTSEEPAATDRVRS